MNTHSSIDSIAAMNDWLAASRDLQERLVPLTVRLQLSEAEVLRGELDVLLGRLQQPLDTVLAAMAGASDAEHAAMLVEALDRRTLCALCALWNHHNARWHARRFSPAGSPWMPNDTQDVWRAVLISLIHDGAVAQQVNAALWPQRDERARTGPRMWLLPRGQAKPARQAVN